MAGMKSVAAVPGRSLSWGCCVDIAILDFAIPPASWLFFHEGMNGWRRSQS